MASDGPVSRWNGVEYSGDDERLLHSVMLMPSGGGRFAARSGRRPGGGQPAASGLVVTVPADAGVIYDESLGGGPWLWALPAPKAITLDARPGAGTSRIDLIVATIYNVGAGRRELAIEFIKGEAKSTPSKPTLPPLSMELAVATVAATGTPVVVASTVRTVAAGGVLPVATVAERDALPSPHRGLAVYVEADESLYLRGATGWARYITQSKGLVTVSSFWTPDPARPLRWFDQGGLVSVFGTMSYNSGVVPNNGSVFLGNLPSIARRWDGVLRSGNAGAIFAGLTTSSTLEWEGRVGAGTGIALDGIRYERA